MSIIETESLTRRFGNLIAVDAPRFSFEPGKVFGLWGPTGGETTTIKCHHPVVPTSGAARVAGFDISRDAAGRATSHRLCAAGPLGGASMTATRTF